MKKLILIVYNNNHIVNAVKETLINLGFDVLITDNKAEGLLKLKESKPDLLVLDVMMDTSQEGFLLLQEIINEKGISCLPILLLTGMLDKKGIDLIKGIENKQLFPYVHFQNKPVNPLSLTEAIRDLMKLKKFDVEQYYHIRKDRLANQSGNLT